MSYYQCPKCGKTVHEDDFDHGVSEQCWACYQASAAARLEAPKARVRAMNGVEVQAFWRTLVKVGKSAEDLAFAAGYAEGLEASRAELDKAQAERDSAQDAFTKYYIKARVYGAIAAEWRKALEAFAGRGEALAAAALAWRNSEQGGVPRSAVEEIGALLCAEAELDKVKAMYSEAANELFALKHGGVRSINEEAQRVVAKAKPTQEKP